MSFVPAPSAYLVNQQSTHGSRIHSSVCVFEVQRHQNDDDTIGSFPVCHRQLLDLTLLRSLEVLVCLLADPVAILVQPGMELPQPQEPERAASRTGKAEVPIATKLQMLEDIDNNVSGVPIGLCHSRQTTIMLP